MSAPPRPPSCIGAAPVCIGASPLRIGVVVPCRNEARVVARKLADLARQAWPPGEHTVVLVDDGSDDGTLERARCAPFEVRAPDASVALELVPNRTRPGKPGAVREGLALLAGRADLLVLTDADVLLAPGALAALARAFEREPELAMASGAQRFVRELEAPEDARSSAAGLYDGLTARVRALESRLGLLFSVHGQLLAWRAGLGLAPTPGLAADDLDLVTQLRAGGRGRPWRARLVPGALFLERKTPPGPERDAQALRRARAYVQLVRVAPPPRLGALAAAQWLAYRWIPPHAPELAASGALVALGLGAASFGPAGLAAAALAGAALAASRPGRRALALLATIARALRAERRAPLAERWEMARE